MLHSAPFKSLSLVQRVLLGVALVVVAFVLIGSLLQPDTSPVATVLPTQSFLVMAILAFAGGLLSFASPCTLPILPAYFAFAFQSGRRQIAANTLFFMLGLATMFSLLGAGASFIGRVLNDNADLLLLFGGSLIVIFGLMSLIGKGFSGFQSEEVERSATLGGSYLFGLTFSLGWTSCTGPILGAVLTLAAASASVLHGVMLLFIYALGLGLPLLVVSTLFGRASRKSLFWRVIRGKGWRVTLPTLLIGLVWALFIWRILVAGANYWLSPYNTLNSRPLVLWQEAALLLVALAATLLWIVTRPAGEGENKYRSTLNLHSTQLLSGALFVLLGLFMISGRLTDFNNLIPTDLALWLAGVEDALIDFFS
ncbi:MAG: cytochrome c biogenesis protein CcdA [Chloroflexi bacterium]|nr:cytochrome c biogenesis protein CcdA [Chloroflexota bacterium]